MKNLLTTLFNSSLFRYAKRLAIVCVFLSISAAAAADHGGACTSTASGKVEPSGSGTVYISKTSGTTRPSTTTAGQSCDNSKDGSHTHYYYYWAVENEGYKFANWNGDENKNNPSNETFDVTSQNHNEVPLVVTAHFKPIISFSSTTWNDADKTRSVEVKASDESQVIHVYKATNFSVEPEDDAPGSITCKLYDGTTEVDFATISAATVTAQKSYKIKITAENASNGDVSTFYFKSEDKVYASLTVTVQKDETKVTFLPNSKLSYAAKDNGGGVEHDIVTEQKVVDLASKYVVLKVDEKSGFRMCRFKIENGNSVKYLYNHSSATTGLEIDYEATNGDVVSLEEIATTYARYRVDIVENGNTKSYYHDNLQNAFDFARDASNSNKIVYVTKSGNVKNLGVPYEIHEGVTLLVPGNAAETCRTEGLTKGDFISTPNNQYQYNKLYKYIILEAETEFEVKGNICVYAEVSYNQQLLGMPANYGIIKMGKDSKITLYRGANMHVSGFISGETSSLIIAQSGSKVFETLQVRDWAGVNRAKEAVDAKKAFVFGQYYVQNIETTLRIEHGAEEYVSCGLESTDVMVHTTPFVIATTDDSQASGLIRLGVGTSFEKYYDRSKDRLYLKIFGKSDIGSAELGNVYVNVEDIIEVNSKDYIFPLNMNISITLDAVNLDNLFPIAMLAESELIINKGASLTLYNDVFIYDGVYHPTNNSGGDVNSWGFHRSPSARSDTEAPVQSIAPTTLSPSVVTDTRYDRKTAWSDAIIDVNGTIITTNSGTLYTTGTADLTDVGAKITSSLGGGEINFMTIPNPIKTETWQNKYKDGTLDLWGLYESFSIPITSAKLHNGGDTFTSYTTTAGLNKTFVYSKTNEKWIIDDVQHASTVTPTFKYKIPDTPTGSQDVTVEFTAPADLTFDIEKIEGCDGFTIGALDWNIDTKTLTIPVSYTQTNEHGEYSATFKITATNKQNLTIPPFTIIASEDYEPKFTSAEKSCDFQEESLCGLTNPLNTLNIKIDNKDNLGNIASLLNSNPKLTWRADLLGDNADDFSFTFGEGENYLSGATVTFTPSTAGDKSATLIIYATSEFVKEGEEPQVGTCTIDLSGSASWCVNPLAFNPNIAQLFEGEENVTLLANTGSGAAIPINAIKYDENYIQLSGSGTDYKITALKATDDGQPTRITINTQGAANGYNTLPSPIHIDITILSAVTWHGDLLYYGSTYTNNELITVHPSITDGYITIDGEYPDDLFNFTPEYAPARDFTLKVGEDAIDGDQNVNFIFTSATKGITEEKTYTLSDLRLLTACVDSEARYSALNLAAIGASYSDGVVTFQSQSDATSSWAMQFYGTPSKLTFTPIGANRWQILQGPTAGSVTQNVSVNWAAYQSGEEVTILLDPSTRFIKFEYGASSDPNNNIGTLSRICVHKFDVVANTDIVYLPVAEGKYKEVTIKHLTETNLTISKSALTNSTDAEKLEIQTNTQPTQYGYYETTLTLSATQTGEYSITAQENDGEPITITVVAFNYPMGLPINTDEWIDNSESEEIKNTKNYYYFYVEESQNVHWWSAENDPYIVFEYTGNKDIEHSMTFAFEGAPSVIKFDYDSEINADEWTIKEYNSTTGQWQNVIGKQTINGVHLEQELRYTTRKVQLIHKSKYVKESKVSNLIIEGYPDAIIDPQVLMFSDYNNDSKTKTFTITAFNLEDIKLEVDKKTDFNLQYQYQQGGENVWSTATKEPIILSATTHPNALGVNKVGNIVVRVNWVGTSSVNQGFVTISNIKDPAAPTTLGVVKLIGAKEYIDSNNTATGIWTGVPDGNSEKTNRPTLEKYTLVGQGPEENALFKMYDYQEVNVENAFAGTEALFDYLIIYGETTTMDGSTRIREAGGTEGSNALTPYFLYRKENLEGGGSRYRFVKHIDNANSGTKGQMVAGDDVIDIPKNSALSAYITGFCPYATTGYTKDDEGVWYFRGPAGSRVDIYLDNCQIYSRNKSESGRKFGKTDNEAKAFAFTNDVVQGSGAVLVFEHLIENVNNVEEGSFNVAIHTIGRNVLKSNYGIYYNPLGDVGNVLAAQVSASVQVRLGAGSHVNIAQTVIDFDDKWPNAPTRNDEGEYTSTYRTNGFLSLQKQANHAPSIDLGNRNTIVNFRGGQVELQNAEIVSPNYKTTFAISHRSGIMGNLKDFQFAYGIGTDDVGGTVNFYDGTTTVIPMEVEGPYRDFYLMDTEVVKAKDQDGNDILDGEGNPTYVTKKLATTSCLRTPQNTFIYGGSHCMIRACNYVTSQGGAPTDGVSPLGKFEYTSGRGWSANIEETKNNADCGLVTPTTFPDKCLEAYYEDKYTYGLKSVAPVNGKLNLWLPKLDCTEFKVDPEVDKELLWWVACMTEIAGGGLGIDAHVGGDVFIDDDDQIRNLLYCQLDDYIYDVISASNGKNQNGDPIYTYMAPAADPTGATGSAYHNIPLTAVGDYKQHNILRESDYEVHKKVYYVTTAKADTWMNFTMPFDVAKISIVETYDESEIEKQFNVFKTSDDVLTEEQKMEEGYLSPMEKTKMFQAEHNAHFAAFFAMTMAIGTYGKDYDAILTDYKNWVKWKYPNENNKRDLFELEHYDGSNFTSAHYYLYKNIGDWQLTEYEVSKAHWEVAPSATDNDGILMNKGETYSMLFPYCTGCDVELDEDNNIVVDEFGLPVLKTRDYWDYWSGKLLIFESTDGDPDPETDTDNKPHVIKGSNYIAASKVDTDTPWIFDGINPTSESGILTGNSTFSMMSVKDYDMRDDIFTYDDTPYVETFLPAELDENTLNPIYETLVPTESFLVVNYPEPIKLITRNGRVVTDQGTTTGGHMPTVGGGHDMFITGTDNGINVAVASPQMVYVVTPAGTIIYRGYVESNINIPLPMSGIYIVKGENEVQKIFY